MVMGTLPPDELVLAKDISENYDKGLETVQKAFAILESDGWIKDVKAESAVVSTLKANDAIELFETRVTLEVEAARQSFPNLTQAHIAAAESAHRTLEHCLEEDRADAHVAFHLALYAAAEQSLLKQVQQKIKESERYLYFKRMLLTETGSEQLEHVAFLRAARVRDVERAVRIVNTHISSCGHLIAEKL